MKSLHQNVEFIVLKLTVIPRPTDNNTDQNRGMEAVQIQQSCSNGNYILSRTPGTRDFPHGHIIDAKRANGKAMPQIRTTRAIWRIDMPK